MMRFTLQDRSRTRLPHIGRQNGRATDLESGVDGFEVEEVFIEDGHLLVLSRGFASARDPLTSCISHVAGTAAAVSCRGSKTCFASNAPIRIWPALAAR